MNKLKLNDIHRWTLLLTALLLAACSSKEEEEATPTGEGAVLSIAIAAPDRPIVTRADVGEISPANDAESAIHSLHIWVFKNSDGSLVKYQNITSPAPDLTKPQVLPINAAFADSPERVDVYVVANEASGGLTLGENTTRAELDDLKFGHETSTDHFGISSLTTDSDIEAKGLPLSAVGKDLQVSGHFPTLRIGTEEGLTALQLTRAVSKVRFVICRKKESTDTKKKFDSIDQIQIDGYMIPAKQYIIPRSSYSFSYEDAPTLFLESESKLGTNDVPEVDDPTQYIYETQAAQDYEDRINDLVNTGTLMQLGPYYLRESDKQLKGTITYTYTDEQGTPLEDQTANFSTATEGDFLRNHSWIVYIYYMDSKIHVFTVSSIGMKKWTQDLEEESIIVYNW
ncbi:MAG: hypothetical protein IJ570_05950 [Prevotella sp.]|nr:hypothetical protein [Prevotella sp.]